MQSIFLMDVRVYVRLLVSHNGEFLLRGRVHQLNKAIPGQNGG